MVAIIVYHRTLPIKRFNDCIIDSFCLKNVAGSSRTAASKQIAISNHSFAFSGTQDHVYHIFLHVFHAYGY